MSEAPKVFISYSHDSTEHADRVLALADRLRADGIDATIDQYLLNPDEGWQLWMNRQIRDAAFVLLVCTATYARRVAGEEQPGVGHGVTWEGNLIYQHLYQAGMENAKFIPVLFAASDQAHIPLPLAGVAYYRVDTDEGYLRLLRRLLNQPDTPAPPLGERPYLPPRERRRANAPPLPPLPEQTGAALSSAAERLQFIQRLYGLPETQLEALIFSLNPPHGVVPPGMAAGGQRVAALLRWAEGTGGPGLAAVRETLEAILNPP